MCPLDWMVWMICSFSKHFHLVECDDIHNLYMGISIDEIMPGLFHLDMIAVLARNAFSGELLQRLAP